MNTPKTGITQCPATSFQKNAYPIESSSHCVRVRNFLRVERASAYFSTGSCRSFCNSSSAIGGSYFVAPRTDATKSANPIHEPTTRAIARDLRRRFRISSARLLKGELTRSPLQPLYADTFVRYSRPPASETLPPIRRTCLPASRPSSHQYKRGSAVLRRSQAN